MYVDVQKIQACLIVKIHFVEMSTKTNFLPKRYRYVFFHNSMLAILWLYKMQWANIFPKRAYVHLSGDFLFLFELTRGNF